MCVCACARVCARVYKTRVIIICTFTQNLKSIKNNLLFHISSKRHEGREEPRHEKKQQQAPPLYINKPSANQSWGGGGATLGLTATIGHVDAFVCRHTRTEYIDWVIFRFMYRKDRKRLQPRRGFCPRSSACNASWERESRLVYWRLQGQKYGQGSLRV